MLNFLLDLFKPKPAAAPPITSEASMNFDASEVGPFLTRLTENPRFALPANLDVAITGALPEIMEGDTRRWRIDGDFDGAPMQLEIEIFMDDISAPDIDFFSSSQVIAEIEKEMNRLDVWDEE
ncbi:hypothetical protein [Pseudophaeobacter arcticus]|uniref:hypothetical protein n=1 Tax=Pseudophaeobacter arcticus TaxID=385492 RepID=UPI00040C4B97|nr:hypothetical protein [Pseudophaeobacter arcticus]